MTRLGWPVAGGTLLALVLAGLVLELRYFFARRRSGLGGNGPTPIREVNGRRWCEECRRYDFHDVQCTESEEEREP